MVESGVADEACAASTNYATLKSNVVNGIAKQSMPPAKAGKGKAAKQQPETKGRKFDFSDEPPDNSARKIVW
jgi:hypothetical protein